jgi:hypothetical protein
VNKHLRSPGSPRRKARLAVFTVLLAGCAVALVVGACSLGSGNAPYLTELTWDQAASLADKAGLKLVKSQEVACFLPAGTVLAQDPLPGVKSPDGTVQVTVAREPVPVQIVSLKPSDPDGNGIENNADIKNLTDGNPDTSWSTERYVSPTFAGLGAKRGVGLAFSLAEEATMVKISCTIGGWRGEVQKLRSNRSPIAIAQLGETEQVNFAEPLSSGRLWFFELAPFPDGDRYGVTINEIGFYK